MWEAAVRETADDPGLFKKHLTSSLYSMVPHFPVREEPEMSMNTRGACTHHRHTAQNQRKRRGLADTRACSKTDNLNVGLGTSLNWKEPLGAVTPCALLSAPGRFKCFLC